MIKKINIVNFLTIRINRLLSFSLVLFFILIGCASFYQLNYEFNKSFEQGKLKEAHQMLEVDKKAKKGKSRFIYFANQGLVLHLLGKYKESNIWLEKAYLFGEDYQIQLKEVILANVTSPILMTYPGESHEHLFLIYYKILNYLNLNDKAAALVECRRLNNRLYSLADKYTSKKKYRKDAFIHNLMGMIYDAAKDYNNAFIAYRNALNIYENEYRSLFGLSTPKQLQKDLIRTASLAGFPEESIKYEQQFGIKYEVQNLSGGELIFLWHNGLAPIKQQLTLSFITKKGSNGNILFLNNDLDLIFPFAYSPKDDEPSITDLSGTKIVFPKYVERPTFFQHAQLVLDEQTYTFELGEDLNAIAFKSLNDRMLLELGKTLLRVTIKKTIERQIAEKNKNLGTFVNIANYLSEIADTRNWQTLPHDINYTRLPLKKGQNFVYFQAKGKNGEKKAYKFSFTSKKGITQFHSYHTLNSEIFF